jgi:hypothetical protein
MLKRLYRNVNLKPEDDYGDAEMGEVCAKEEATVITSQSAADPELHYITIDIDHPCILRPSETPGHFHLLIDQGHPLTWKQYEKLLEALAAAHVVEYGYVGAAKARKMTRLALRPWKGQ